MTSALAGLRDPSNADLRRAPTAAALRASAGGRVLAGGLYRVMDDAAAAAIRPPLAAMYPDGGAGLDPFGSDWLGRVFATRADRPGMVVIAEPGTADLLEVPVGLEEFHASEIVEHADAALAASFYDAWRADGGAAPEASQCVGYRQPLFLGGADEVENLQLSDMDVYWSVMAQTVERIRSRTDSG